MSHYSHNYKGDKEQYKTLGWLCSIIGLITLPFFGIVSLLGFAFYAVLFFITSSTTKCVHWRLYDGCMYCEQLFCTSCHKNFGTRDSYLADREPVTLWDTYKIISDSNDKPAGCGSVCQTCLDQLSKQYGNKKRREIEKSIFVFENLSIEQKIKRVQNTVI